MAWTIPREAWWQTSDHEETVERPDPRPQRRSPWASVVDDDLDPEDEDTLYALTAIEDTDEDEHRGVDLVPCWTAELYADGRFVAATEHWLFRGRGDLLGFLRWVAANAPGVPEREAAPAEYPRRAVKWEEAFGPPAWTPPDRLQDCGWVRTSGGWMLYGPEGPLLWSVGLQPREIADFLLWFREYATTFNIDPPPPAWLTGLLNGTEGK